MVVNFFGKRGAGKTTAISGQLEDCVGPVVVVDILGNFNAENLSEKFGLNCFETGDIETAILKIKEYSESQDEKFKKENKIIVIQAAHPSLTVDYMSAALWEIEGGTLVLDEADSFEFPEAPCYDQIIRYGRNKNISVITGVRRPAEIHKNITAAANKMFAFGTHEPRDIEYFEKTIFGTKAQELINCPKYSGIFVDYDEQVMGNFKIDELGKIYQSDVVSIR